MASSTSSTSTRTAKIAPKATTIGRRERSKLEKWARIKGAARALFSQQGFAATTTQQIADAADIGTGTLFLYAKTKEDLLILVFKDEMTAIAREAFQGFPTEALAIDQFIYVFERMIVYHDRDRKVAATLVREVVIPRTPELNAELQEMLDVIIDGLESIVRSAQETNSIAQSLDPHLTARSIFSIYLGGLLTWLGNRQTRAQFLTVLRSQLAVIVD